MLGLALNHLTTSFLLLPLAGLVVLTLPLQHCYQKLDHLKITHAKIHQSHGPEPVAGNRILVPLRCCSPEMQGRHEPRVEKTNFECKA